MRFLSCFQYKINHVREVVEQVIIFLLHESRSRVPWLSGHGSHTWLGYFSRDDLIKDSRCYYRQWLFYLLLTFCQVWRHRNPQIYILVPSCLLSLSLFTLYDRMNSLFDSTQYLIIMYFVSLICSQGRRLASLVIVRRASVAGVRLSHSKLRFHSKAWKVRSVRRVMLVIQPLVHQLIVFALILPQPQLFSSIKRPNQCSEPLQLLRCFRFWRIVLLAVWLNAGWWLTITENSCPLHSGSTFSTYFPCNWDYSLVFRCAVTYATEFA